MSLRCTRRIWVYLMKIMTENYSWNWHPDPPKVKPSKWEMTKFEMNYYTFFRLNSNKISVSFANKHLNSILCQALRSGSHSNSSKRCDIPLLFVFTRCISSDSQHIQTFGRYISRNVRLNSYDDKWELWDKIKIKSTTRLPQEKWVPYTNLHVVDV